MKINNRFIGGNIRHYMNEHELTQKELAEKANITPAFLSDVLNNKKPCPQRLLTELAYLFAVDESELEEHQDDSLADSKAYLISDKELDRRMIHEIVHQYIKGSFIRSALEKKNISYNFVLFLMVNYNVTLFDEESQEIYGQRRNPDIDLIRFKKDNAEFDLTPDELLNMQNDIERYKNLLFLEIMNCKKKRGE